MTDLIERLREAAKSMDVLPGGGRVISLETQAAAEIERLRAALQEFVNCDLTPIVNFFNDHGEAAPACVFAAQEIAREALK